MLALGEVPFADRRQEWQREADGFSLGRATDHIVKDTSCSGVGLTLVKLNIRSMDQTIALMISLKLRAFRRFM
jgi:hypothetical protein